ncbi:MAG: [FeFe] hydrogenase H-cluster radical SAM maturase HydE [Bacteroidales bacterium]|nr:[FeFe] hydrogenase H-cluster radical SAM maturase HydE [Bacteroidales bacterium]MCF8328001.1 [FeFe] hydrogenase H-cluster radical SAM maturase HydE [Bacteroidales bacterium]
MSRALDIIKNEDFTSDNLVYLLSAEGDERKQIYEKAAEIKDRYVGNKVYFRGLIEFSNICAKNCFYCGIRRDNGTMERYYVNRQEVIQAAEYAWKEGYGSIVIQSGERTDKWFVDQITELLQQIEKATNKELGITLSMGEQSEETFSRWKEAGADRYLLRIEASSKELYHKIHPNDKLHSYDKRLNALKLLQKLDYQTGTGVMVGLPFQTLEHLANDLLFFKNLDIDMAGMGPYIEHEQTPLYQYKDQLMPKKMRFELSLRMVALLRIMMKDVNIAATTAMQTLDDMGREKALKVGANVIMPNLTPVKYREGYLLYEDKPCIDEEAEECKSCLEARIHLAGGEIAYNEQGNPKHYYKRTGKTDK